MSPADPIQRNVQQQNVDRSTKILLPIHKPDCRLWTSPSGHPNVDFSLIKLCLDLLRFDDNLADCLHDRVVGPASRVFSIQCLKLRDERIKKGRAMLGKAPHFSVSDINGSERCIDPVKPGLDVLLEGVGNRNPDRKCNQRGNLVTEVVR